MTNLTEDLVKALKQLVADAPGADAYHLRIQDDFEQREVGADELDALFADFQHDYEEAVNQVRKAWGPPTYEGAVDSDDFPAWSEALVLTYWQREEALAFISLRHDDDHEPMFIEVGALTDDEVATLLYTKS